MLVRMRRVLTIVVVAAVLAAALLGGSWILEQRRAQARVYPSPNAFDTFLLAAAEVGAAGTNEAQALKLARDGLKQQSLVRLPGSLQEMTPHLERMAAFKRLAAAFVAEAAAAVREKDAERAAQTLLDAIRFSHEASRGGLMIDRLAALSNEDLAFRAFRTNVISLLDGSQRKKVADALEEISTKAEPFSVTIETERLWSRRHGGLQGMMLRAFKPGLMRPVEVKFQAKVTQAEEKRAALIKELRESP